jgi:cytochrome c
MKNAVMCVVVVIYLLALAGISFAAQATKADAKAMVEKAAAYIKANGKEKALAEFNNPKGKFIDGDLYIFAYDFNGVNLALGSNPKMVGKSLLDLQDASGKPFIKDLILVAQRGSGWYEYKWSHPKTKKIQPKISYVLKIDDSMFIGCGIYK